MAAKHDYAIGIDLGTSNSCVGVVRNGRVEIIADERGSRLTPSFVAFTDEERLIGESAKFQRTMNPANTVYEVKRLIGRKFSDEAVQNKLPHWPYRVVNDRGNPKICVQYLKEEKFFTPEEISAMVLAKMKETAEAFLGCEVRKAVITVPAYFSYSQRQATIDAGTIAGLQILKIINEPTAAAIAYGEDTNVFEEINILIFDFGGRKLDVAVLKMKKGNYALKSVEGISQLGGRDLDSRIVRFMIGDFRKKTGLDISNDLKAQAKMTKAAERIKINLSGNACDRVQLECLSRGQDFSFVLYRGMFESLCADIFEETMKCVDRAIVNAGLTTNEIHEVILVGGSIRIPKLRKMLEKKIPNMEIKRTIRPEEVVAYGAAVQAAMLNNDRSVDRRYIP
ncbi:heat shock 70 kDa protein 6-like [Hyalella azteca]|uniref:Heat shock 70 kDa protein 6-like n=1 Tax=Hyalella azteca TaxID=294128 RepID=A0A8B7NX13_HYAAZ|nr:heat shock 70 kDa protein 6-like [Hyalella azteca]